MSVEKKFLFYNLPDELCLRILSYLYFSDYISDKIKPIIETIKNYKYTYLENLLCEYDTNLEMVSYFVLKYFLYDKSSCDKLKLDYTMISKSNEEQYDELKRIFTSLRLVDILRIVKYIEQQGLSSEFYNN